MSKKERSVNNPISFSSKYIQLILIAALLCIAVWFGYNLYVVNSNYKDKISDLENMLAKLEQYADDTELDKDGKPYVNIQIQKPSDISLTSTEINEILTIVQGQYEQNSNSISSQITLFSILITAITIMIPIFSYNFIQKDQIDRLNKQYDDFSKEFNNKTEEINSAFNNEIERINKAIEQSSKVSEAIVDPDSSDTVITPISDSNMDRANAYYLEAKLYMRQKDYKKGLESINSAIELEPENQGYYNNRGVILAEMKKYNDALVDFNNAIKLNPSNAIYIYNKGNTFDRLKLYKEAISCKTLAIELEPNNAKYYDSRGLTLHLMKRYNDALVDVSTAIKLEPNNNAFKDHAAAILNRLNRYQEALEILKEVASSLNSGSVYRHSAFAKLRIAQLKNEKIPDEVWIEFDKAIELNKDSWANNLAKAEAYLLTQQNEKAKQSLDDAFKIDTENPEIYHLYALYYEAIGDAENAKKHHQLADKYGYIKGPDEE